MGKIVIRPTTTKGVVILGNTKSPPPVVMLANGQKITGQYLNSEGGLHQFKLGIGPDEAQGMVVSYEGKTSSSLNFEGGAAEYRTESGDVSSIQQAPNKALRGGGSVGGGAFGGGTTAGGFGAIPQYLGDQFPSPQINPDRPIPLAPYNETSIKKFAGEIGDFNRTQLGVNSKLAKETALDTLDTELAGLEKFVPRAATVQRGEVLKDNTFNQASRTAQINAVLPNAIEDIESQRKRANAYASGKAPDSIIDAALELGVRSSSADAASAGGFGVNSSASRKVSDLMSADKRLQLASYGEQLLGTNQQQAASLLLAPTEYANAGSQVQVMPSQSGGTLQQAEQARADRTTVIDPGQALSTQIQQQQFMTKLVDETNRYNSTTGIQNGQFNTSNVNNFALSKFNYQVGYANAVAGAQQIDINTGLALSQQEQAQNIAIESKKETQAANDKKAKEAGKNSGLTSTIDTVGNIVSVGNSLYQFGSLLGLI